MRQIPFQGDAHHEADAGQQTVVVNTCVDNVYHPVLRLCHVTDHAAELDEVRNQKVDDVDGSNVIISYLQESKSE